MLARAIMQAKNIKIRFGISKLNSNLIVVINGSDWYQTLIDTGNSVSWFEDTIGETTSNFEWEDYEPNELLETILYSAGLFNKPIEYRDCDNKLVGYYLP